LQLQKTVLHALLTRAKLPNGRGIPEELAYRYPPVTSGHLSAAADSKTSNPTMCTEKPRAPHAVFNPLLTRKEALG